MKDIERSELFSNKLRYYLEKSNVSQLELANAVGVSTGTVSHWLNRGSIPSGDKINRICGFFSILPEDLIPDYKLPSNIILPKARRVPILGTVCAGNGIVIEENYLGDVIVDKSISADYALYVSGDSMSGADINEGDLIYIKQCPFEDGKIYVIGIYGIDEAVVRRINFSNGQYILTPANPNYAVSIYDTSDVFLIGKVTGIYREIESNNE